MILLKIISPAHSFASFFYFKLYKTVKLKPTHPLLNFIVAAGIIVHLYRDYSLVVKVFVSDIWVVASTMHYATLAEFATLG